MHVAIMENKQTELFTHLRDKQNDTIVVTALASELPEYAPEKLLFTGVGKINATMVLTRYLIEHPEIKKVINYGTAGAAHGVTKGDLVKCTTFVQGDMDCSLITDGPGVTFGDDIAVAGIINFGTDGLICRTQDQFVTDLDALDLFQNLLEGRKFNVVDMEAYALAKVCATLGKDFICYKYISDDADSNADDEWEENVHKGEPMFYELLEKVHGFEYT